ncbi:MAG: NADPH:quinone oxidoreductase family protein [Proteobacteria bacterium]|nr:NADPH:quinone oxidoreductase family protein [Pseudomonadota bacterium]
MPPGHHVVVRELGEDPREAIERFITLEPMTMPDPQTLAPTDVVVAVRATSVNWVDIVMTSGQYQHVPEPPYTPGLEYAGEVAWVGPEVTTHAIGDRVLSDGFATGPRSSGAHRRNGGFASYAVAPAHALLPIPGDLTFDEACNLLGNYETAYHCLVTRGRLAAGETVLVLGASGSTGLAAIHVAKLVGARTIALGRSAAKLDVVRAQGADLVVETGDLATLRDRIKALAPGGVDVVYDGVGGELSTAALRCLRFGGRFLIVGWAATPNVSRGKGQRGAPNANQLPTNLIMMKGIDVLGCPTVIGTTNDPSLRQPRLAQLFAWVAGGQLRPYVSHRFALADWKAAMLAKLGNDVIGGCVLHP